MSIDRDEVRRHISAGTLIRRTVTRTYTRDGITALEAYANHPASSAP